MAGMIPEHFRKALLGSGTSKINKIHIAVGLQSRGYYLDWEWNPTTIGGFKSPVKFRFEPDGKWVDSKCFDDVYQAMKGSDGK